MEPIEQLQKLEANKKLIAKNFNYAVYFQPENCSTKFYIPSHDTGQEAKSLFSL